MKKFLVSLVAALLLCSMGAAQTALPGPVVQTVTFAATPTFNAAAANIFVLTLTGNVTSSTLTGLSVGQTVTFTLSQDGTGSRTFTWPTNVGGAPTIKSAASAVTNFTCQYDGLVCNPVTPVVVTVAASYTNATTTFSNVPELSFAVALSRNYTAVCRIVWQGSAGTTGPKYQFTGPGSPTNVAAGVNSIVTATTVITASATAFSSAMANSGTVTTATNFTDTVTIGIVNGANAGTVQLQAAANGAGTLTIQPGSSCTVYGQ